MAVNSPLPVATEHSRRHNAGNFAESPELMDRSYATHKTHDHGSCRCENHNPQNDIRRGATIAMKHRGSFFISAILAYSVCFFASGVLAGQPDQNADWPCWRGPNATGLADGRNLPIHWDTKEHVRWSVQLPGWGTSSPVVYGNRVFVTSEVEDGGKKSLLTLCYDRSNGRGLWRHDFGFGVNQSTHQKSNLAVNTPAVTEDAVYVAFGNADIARYSHDGQLMWVTSYLSLFGDPKMAWGYCLSPVVLDDAILFPWDHHTGPCFLIGLDKQSGEIAWKKDRPIGTAHATPLLVEHHGQTDILVPGKNRLTAFDAHSHAEFWQYGEGEGKGMHCVAQEREQERLNRQ